MVSIQQRAAVRLAADDAARRDTLLFAAWCAALLIAYAATLWGDWRSNDQYSFGFFVPFLTALLLRLRWRDRPPPFPPRGLGRLGAGAALGCLTLVTCPFILVYMAHPDWRLLLWSAGAWTLSFATTLTWLAGGRAWFRHFVPPWLLILTAIPWPTMIEGPLLRALLHSVTLSTVSLLQLAGVAAAQVGNSIQLPNGTVGVEDACSGIRSFQLGVMVGIFCGEFSRLNLLRRLVLLGATLVCAFLVNLMRSGSLALIFGRGGPELMHAWHDRLGFLAMLVVPVCGWGIAWLLETGQDRRKATRQAPGAEPGSGKDGEMPPERPLRFPQVPGWVALVGVCLIVVASVVGSEAFFRIVSKQNAQPSPIGLEILHPPPEFEQLEIPSTIRAALRFSRAHAWGGREEERRSPIIAFNAIWERGEMSTFVGVHRPESCLPAGGYSMVGESGTIAYMPRGAAARMQFRSQQYSNGNTSLRVFYASGTVSSGGDVLIRGASGAERIREAFAGHRLESRWLLQFAVGGNMDEGAAWKIVEKFLDGSELAVTSE